ncbi:hypothetical protein HW115_14625 [Verrucomicrobiaceae bacterium N1E253]|uniref:Uncharacterized protein n=1 Tax=Oceaniferula marina TaxID=2748318 RepID=A0A851GP02_9BACT|nr:hypothetical protein [Oceaniferula marina]NWK56855.1 hypothetical protein [Oceaniferula marina]
MHTTTLTQGVERHQPSVHHTIRPTFTIACWLLALFGFIQLLSVGTALAVRNGAAPSQQVQAIAQVAKASEPATAEIHPRSVEQILQDLGSSSSYAAAAGMADHAPVRVQPKAEVMVAAVPALVTRPRHFAVAIANPRVERLVQEARNLHLEGDMMRAMLKLDEAERMDAEECAVLYEKGLLFEDMSLYTKAADQYQQIQQMGLVKAGPYFNLAARKLTEGMDTAVARRHTIAIGPMKVNKGSGFNAGQQADVAVTLLGRPDLEIQSDDVEVQVHFYDRVNGGEIKKAASNAQITPTWADTSVDWQDIGNEETLRVSYRIPELDLAEQHLLGRREFYGFIVELLYKGEVVDQQAYPRNLHSIHAATNMVPAYQDQGMPWLPEEGGSLLPSKEGMYGAPDALPSH